MYVYITGLHVVRTGLCGAPETEGETGNVDERCHPQAEEQCCQPARCLVSHRAQPTTMDWTASEWAGGWGLGLQSENETREYRLVGNYQVVLQDLMGKEC